MKTAKFDLELAIAGHPLITSGGDKVTDFKYFKDLNSDYKIRVVADGCILAYQEAGRPDWDFGFGKRGSMVGWFLLLDKSIPWEPELKMGDRIEIKKATRWEERIFIKYGEADGVVVVIEDDANKYLQGRPFDTIHYHEYRRINKDIDLDIKITCNGKDVKLSDISEETLIKLRNQSK